MAKSNGIAKVSGGGSKGQGADKPKAPVKKMPKSDGIAGVRGDGPGGGGLAAILSKGPV